MALTFGLCVFWFLVLSVGLHLILTVIQPIPLLRSLGDGIRTVSTVLHELLHFGAMVLMGMEISPSDVHLKAGEIIVRPTPRNIGRNFFLKQFVIVFTPTLMGVCLVLWMWWFWITAPGWGVRLLVLGLDIVFIAMMRPSMTDLQRLLEPIGQRFVVFLRQLFEIGMAVGGLRILAFPVGLVTIVSLDLSAVLSFGLWLVGLELFVAVYGWLFLLLGRWYARYKANRYRPRLSPKHKREFKKEFYSPQDSELSGSASEINFSPFPEDSSA